MASPNLSFEPMDIDTSGRSVRDMDISYDEPDEPFYMSTVIKTEKADIPSEDIQPVSDYKKSEIQPTVKKFPKKMRQRPTKSKPDEPFYMSTVIKTEKADIPSEDIQPVSDNTAEIQPTVKKFHINMQRPTKSYKNVINHPISIGVAILLSIFALHMYSLKCFDDFNVEELKNTLTAQLFGQSEAINTILETLEQEERSKLLIFSGGTGVGKTFVSSILLDSLGPCSNVYHYTMPTFTNTFTTDFMYGLTMCKKSLLIVDDLTANDMQIKIQIQKVVEKSEYLGKEITVILIYNCYESTADFKRNCDDSFRQKILENFSEIKVSKRFVDFKPLTKYHLKQCIKQELADRLLGEKELEDVMKNFNVDVDGCKGVHSKMKYLNIV